MLLLLGLTTFGLALSFIYGWAAELVAARFLRWGEGQELPFPITTLLGVAVLSGLVGTWSLFARVGLWTLVALSVAALAALAGMRRSLPARIAGVRAQLRLLDA